MDKKIRPHEAETVDSYLYVRLCLYKSKQDRAEVNCHSGRRDMQKDIVGFVGVFSAYINHGEI